MPKVTRCKYIAIGVNVFIILLSVSILVSLYLSFEESKRGQSTSSSSQTLVRQQEERSEASHNKTTALTYLPAPLQDIINWLGQSVSSSGEDRGSSASLFTACRPLIVAAFLSYILAIVGLIAIGLDHVSLLIIFVVIFVCIFASALAGLVFSIFTSLFENNFIIFDFWNCLLITIIGLSALEIYTTAILIYEIFMERRVERSREYSLAKMVPNIDEL